MFEQQLSGAKDKTIRFGLESAGKLVHPFEPFLARITTTLVDRVVRNREFIEPGDPKYAFRRGDADTPPPIINLNLSDEDIQDELNSGRN